MGALLRQYSAGTALACEPVDQGLLNRGYRLCTTRGRYFLKHHFDPETADPAAIVRQHRATRRLADLGVPVAPPLTGRDGRTVAVVGGHAYALHPWIEGRHRHGGQLTTAQCGRLGALLGVVHASLERVMPTHARARTGPAASSDPADTFALIEDLLGRVRRHRPADSFDALARHRLLERRALLEQHAGRRPAHGGSVGWVHGDFHPFNLLYKGDAPAAIVDWDRLGVKPRAEEAVRAAAIFFVRPAGTLDLPKVRAYARAYRRAARAAPSTLAAAVHRVWWERLNDFWMLRWHYERGDTRADPQFPAASALAVWWTRHYDAVCDAFSD
ncbi:aminoglycoside phosphotransferase [Streptomyces resistomycificus]|uniref:Aminoglycoside phosphotransferase n=1 Tax=Streptomyces resistomycificus TaxID=67356 RepID=A0A0L8LA77_9ACTN|nr:aminoglycoside phosphotransferase [Streptomyces resistomycificus]KUN97721.1 aminoglycoside phosphotransferase [Streptomyces resistomycificus]